MSDFESPYNGNQFDKFTKEAKQALVMAQEAAKQSKSDYVGTEHVLIGILSQGNSLGASILANFGVSLDTVNLVLKTVGRVNRPRPGMTATAEPEKTGVALSGFAKKVIESALRLAHEYNHLYVGTEHLLFALVGQENTAATVILENMKINVADIRQEIIKIFDSSKKGPKGPMPSSNMNPLEFLLSGLQGVLSAGGDRNNDFMDSFKHKGGTSYPPHPQPGTTNQPTKTPALDYFTTDLVAESRAKKIDPIIGRAKEIERTISILQRKTKNNPVLIGESGVGKTAIVEGLAQAIVNEEVPDEMLDKRILSLSMTSVVAGTKYRGEFEDRIKQIIDEASSQPNVILFIDELHTVIGAGSAEGSLDAANILKPALSRGRIRVIGATTTNEYRKHIEEDAALERRFQSVMVDEPSEEETVAILRGLRASFEDHHNLLISDKALKEAVYLSKRYINDRYLPDKAIDLIDEASALKSIKIKGNTSKLKTYQQELNTIIKSKEEAVSKQNYEQAAELRTKELQLIDSINSCKTVKIPREKRAKVTEDDIAHVLSKMTGIPVQRLLKSDIDRLMKLEEALKKRIVGQEEAIKTVSQAIRRSRAGISDTRRPIGSFIFLGPTGVGKTELVKTLASEVYNDEEALIKIDMSEFMERHNTSRLVGATAGYVGYDDGGQLTEMVRRRPYSVILFDEIEKAHPEVMNLLLQILEDGCLTDSKGRKTDFRNTIIVMTSNIGAEILTKEAGPMGFNLEANELEQAKHHFADKKEKVLAELKESFRPEFLNRIDKVITFEALTHNHIKEIVSLHLKGLQKRLEPKKITLECNQAALELLAEKSYDPDYGARPVRRTLQELVEDHLTQDLLEGKFAPKDTVQIILKNKEIELVKKK